MDMVTKDPIEGLVGNTHSLDDVANILNQLPALTGQLGLVDRRMADDVF